MKNSLVYLSVLGIIGLFSCEDVIEIDDNFSESKVVVDAWLDDQSRAQKVVLTNSQAYFDNSFPVSINDATVKVVVNGGDAISFEFVGDGVYEWIPPSGDKLGEVGDDFQLNIQVGGEAYTASTTMNRVPEIDSIAIVFEEEQLGFPEGLYAELFVDDFVGTGDTYWARTWKNGELLNKPEELLIIYDATFDAGSGLDGTTIIFPLRRGINPIDDEVEEGEEEQAPYVPGDSIYVELSSISNEAHRFLQIAFEQMTNGDNGIFALPIANTESNVSSFSEKEALGFFNVAAISTKSRIVE